MPHATASEKTYIDALYSNLHIFSQNLLELYYLRPYPPSSKEATLERINFKSRKIERPIHGAMHAGRVSLYIPVLHKLIKTILPKYISDVFTVLKNDLDLNEEQILCLMRYTGLLHDSAREDEAQDRWDNESGQNMFEFLHENGISENLAIIFSIIIAFKDDADEFENVLKKHGIMESNFPSYQYLRRLVFWADCFDIMRCTAQFKMTIPMREFILLDGFERAKHEPMVEELARSVHYFIHSLHDMPIPCRINFTTSKYPAKKSDTTSSFSLSHKIKFEYADNILSALLKAMAEISFFAKFLPNDQLKSTELASSEPQFNPYIHGTNSFIFPLLEKTNYTILPPQQMIEKYGVAPIGGELTKGGHDSVRSDGKTSFARVSRVFKTSRISGYYELDQVLSGYTKFSTLNESHLKTLLSSELNQAPHIAFSNINLILIYLTRAKEHGLSLESLNQEILEAKKWFKAVIQVYWLVLLLGKHIHPNFVRMSQFSNNEIYTLSCWIDAHLKLTALCERILVLGIDLKAIYLNPTPEAVKKAIDLLGTQGNVSFMNKQFKEPTLTEIEIGDPGLFTESAPDYSAYQPEQESYALKYLSYRFPQNLIHYNINSLIENFLLRQVSQKLLLKFHKKIIKIIQELERLGNVFDQLLQKNSHNIFSAEVAKFFIHSAFPIVLICENEENLFLANFHTQEYRAQKPLVLGEDIQMIATNTPENQAIVKQWLIENNLSHVAVILIKDLKESQTTGSRPIENCNFPSEPYSLASLCAKEFSKLSSKNSFQEKDENSLSQDDHLGRTQRIVNN